MTNGKDKDVERELTNQARELTDDELERLSGGTPSKGSSKGASKNSQPEYLTIELKEVFVTSL
jgi:hypothetical protein